MSEYRWNVRLCHCSIHTFEHISWPGKPFLQCPLIWWIFLPSFIEVHSLHTEICERHVNGWQRIDGPQTMDGLMARWVTAKHNAFAAYCWEGRQLKKLKHNCKWKKNNCKHKNCILTALTKEKSAPATINRWINDAGAAFRHMICNGTSSFRFRTLSISCHCRPAETNQQLPLNLRTLWRYINQFLTLTFNSSSILTEAFAIYKTSWLQL